MNAGIQDIERIFVERVELLRKPCPLGDAPWRPPLLTIATCLPMGGTESHTATFAPINTSSALLTNGMAKSPLRIS
jgi:hypothetical protein